MTHLLDLNQLQLFVAVADAKSFSRAAAAINVPRSSVSKRIAALERSLGVQLFSRTTRQVMLTDAGKSLRSELAPNLQKICAALSSLTNDARELGGPLRLTAPVDISVLLLPVILAKFASAYPRVRVDLRVSNATKDLVAENIDVALRVLSARQRDSSLVVRKLADVKVAVFAAPQYLRRSGSPNSLREAAQHQWISFSAKRMPPPLDQLNVVGEIHADDAIFIRSWLCAGRGLGVLPEFVARPAVENGTLVRVLPELRPTVGALCLVHTPVQHIPRRIVALRQHLVTHFRDSPLSTGLSDQA